ncbi:uncharacterized protein BDR25DRAFT_340140 [Lindgomyces ingoldianus]|uniref:Uncharacterized protein n=1 Tax=Lindgomyces ingoldianus TaxID=673940 RepID=A0ACB6R7S0_9PLEO|nr:uncharacterized protein BDR25DRAFT_340140 [Lindgomyces ingoldianus]KAF2475353.1 hypothetical protein BDR25DRAFT_340140 [Lindgomyces ingoldianus]
MPAVLDLSKPAALPPPGVTANFANPPNHAIFAYSVVSTLHLEDYIIPFAWLAAIGHFAVSLVIFDFAPLIHTWDVTLETLSHWLFYFRLSSILYNFSVLLIKFSMLVQVLRVFVPRGSQSKTFYIIHTLIVTNIIFYITLIFSIIFNCTPIEKGWKPWLKGTCLSITNIAMAQAIFNLVSDLMILTITQKVIWEIVRVKKSERIRLSAVFFAGIIPCAFSGMCLYYNNKEKKGVDLTYNAALMSMACYGEIVSGMFVLFLPVLPRFFSHIKVKPLFPSLFRSNTRSGNSQDLDFVDVGVGAKRGRSVWHISYTQKEGRTERVLTKDFGGRNAKELDFGKSNGTNMTETVSSVYSQDEIVGPNDGSNLVGNTPPPRFADGMVHRIPTIYDLFPPLLIQAGKRRWMKNLFAVTALSEVHYYLVAFTDHSYLPYE